VFVLTQHRSGGTLLARLLNCHEKLVVWGEHAGFLHGLAEAHLELERWADQLPERSTLELRRYVRVDRLADIEFRPWMSPVSPADFRKECRRALLSLFTRGLRPDQRWGFKEIRYHRPELIRFLHELFPRGQFVVLQRDVTSLCISSLLVPWTLQRLLANGIGRDEGAFLQRVEDQLHSILAMRRNWTEGLASAGLQSILVQYEDIVSDMPRQMDCIFQFLDLSVDDAVRARMRISFGAVASTPKGTVAPSGDKGYLTASTIREAVERLLPRVTMQLAEKRR